MKKFMSLLLAAVMCFSLVACGNGNEASGNNEPQADASVSQQETASPNAPAEKNEPQQSTTPEATPDPKPAEPVAIELTTENFTEYFELVEILDIPTNEFGEVDKDKPVSIEFVYVLKPEYQEKFADKGDCDSSYAIEWAYTSLCQECVFDYDTNTYTLGEVFTNIDSRSALSVYITDPEEKTNIKEVKLRTADRELCVGEMIFYRAELEKELPEYCYKEEFKEILRVQGTLYLYE